MFCTLTQWLISRAEDGGKKIPRFAERHAGHCGACLEYARFTGSLSFRLSGDTSEFLAKAPDFSLEPTELNAEEAGRRTRDLPRRRPFVHPFPAAAAALAVVASALVLFRVVLHEPALTSAEKKAAIASLKSVTAAPDQFRGAVEEAEFSLANERLILEKSVLSAVEYFQSRLNIKVERKNAPKTL